jgi:topoisomerase-4 subunit A
VEAAQLPPGRGDGAPATSLVEVQEGAHIMYVVAGKPDTNVLVASTNGYGFLTKLSDMTSNRKAGREFMSVDEGHTPIPPAPFEEAAGNYAALVSENGRMLLLQLAELKYMAKGRGLSLMGLDKGEKLVAALVTNQPSVIVTGVGRGGKFRELPVQGKELGHYAGHRALKGRVLPDKLKPHGIKTPPKPAEG